MAMESGERLPVWRMCPGWWPEALLKTMTRRPSARRAAWMEALLLGSCVATGADQSQPLVEVERKMRSAKRLRKKATKRRGVSLTMAHLDEAFGVGDAALGPGRAVGGGDLDGGVVGVRAVDDAGAGGVVHGQDELAAVAEDGGLADEGARLGEDDGVSGPGAATIAGVDLKHLRVGLALARRLRGVQERSVPSGASMGTGFWYDLPGS
jgi:hypothetical protein